MNAGFFERIRTAAARPQPYDEARLRKAIDDLAAAIATYPNPQVREKVQADIDHLRETLLGWHRCRRCRKLRPPPKGYWDQWGCVAGFYVGREHLDCAPCHRDQQNARNARWPFR